MLKITEPLIKISILISIRKKLYIILRILLNLANNISINYNYNPIPSNDEF